MRLATLLLTLTSSAVHAAFAADRIYLVSTRALGSRCEAAAMAEGLRCEKLTHDAGGAGRWDSVAWNDLAAELNEPMPTIVYVHGNRVEWGADKSHGLSFYRSIAGRKSGGASIRFVIWSWPSAKISGFVKDYHVKAARTKQVAWQLAWAIDQTPTETPLALVGYSFGARVVTGALHLLAGGQLGELELTSRVHADRRPVRAALVAAAVDADWIRPGGFHGRALQQVEQLLLVNNHRDPAMRFYHLAMEGRSRPLGYMGADGLASLGDYAKRVRAVDATAAVGRSHALGDYLAASSQLGPVLEQVAQLSTSTTPQLDAGAALYRRGASPR